MWIRPTTALLFAILTVNIAFSGSLTEHIQESFRQVGSEFVRVMDEPEPKRQQVYPFWARGLTSEWLKWDPHPKPFRGQSSCDLGDALQSSDLDSWLQQCEPKLTGRWRDLPSNLYLTMMINLDPAKYPRARFVHLKLSGGVRLQGLLALKGDNKPRPLAILRLGIFSNATDFLPERFLFLQLFEQMPFNVLVLESNSSIEFISRNKKLALAGYDEGLQNIEVAERLLLPTEPMSKLISSIHLVGLSMGGHGTLMAAILNDSLPSKKRPIRSFAAFCPLINMRETSLLHNSQLVFKNVVNYWSRMRLKGLDELFPNLGGVDYLPGIFDYLETLELPLDDRVAKILAKNRLSYLERNNFFAHLAKIESPFAVVSTIQDPIVPYELNSARLKELWRGKKSQTVLALHQAYHCSFPGAYPWNFLAGYLESRLLGSSRLTEKQRSFPLDRVLAERLSKDAWSWSLDFLAKANSSDLQVTIVARPNSWMRFFTSKRQSFQLPLHALDAGEVTPQLEASESSFWQRWASLQVKSSVEKGELKLRWKVWP